MKKKNKFLNYSIIVGKKGKEIAKKLNITEVKVKTKLHRIRKRIKKELKKGGYENGK